jgi:hypothetical protein
MTKIPVRFLYLPSVRHSPFVAVTLTGSWDSTGQLSNNSWSSQAMPLVTGPDGSDGFATTVELDDSQVGQVFSWGVWARRSNR